MKTLTNIMSFVYASQWEGKFHDANIGTIVGAFQA
jgi:hypothetical protein